MKRKLCLVTLLLCASFTLSFGLSDKERGIVLHAKTQLELAQKQLKDAQTYAEWADKSQADAWTYAGQTDSLAKQAKKDVDAAYQREKALAAERDKMLPVYKAVTRWFSLGAFVWGTQQLLKHLLILALFGAGLMLTFWGLTFVFPFLLPAFRIVTAFFYRILASIENRISKQK